MTAAHISPPVISGTSSLLLAPASSASSAPIRASKLQALVARVYRNDPTVRDGFQIPTAKLPTPPVPITRTGSPAFSAPWAALTAWYAVAPASGNGAAISGGSPVSVEQVLFRNRDHAKLNHHRVPHQGTAARRTGTQPNSRRCTASRYDKPGPAPATMRSSTSQPTTSETKFNDPADDLMAERHRHRPCPHDLVHRVSGRLHVEIGSHRSRRLEPRRQLRLAQASVRARQRRPPEFRARESIGLHGITTTGTSSGSMFWR